MNNLDSTNSTANVSDDKPKTTISLKEYIDKLCGKGCFIIPDYQRGYVWGQDRKDGKDGKDDSVTNLIQTLVKAFDDKKNEVFLQGITVHPQENSNDICVVDGQQRTTFFYLLLKYLEYDGYIRIRYEIRKASNLFLGELNVSDADVSQNDDEEYQDIFFFKKTLRIFSETLKKYDKPAFIRFLLDHVRFLYVEIPAEQATIVFTMMNGNKAEMKDEELIKAELLRCASLESNLIFEAEHSETRGRLAREWDKWLYWWNKTEVKQFFRSEGRQLGWLLPLACKNQKVSFDEFKDKFFEERSIKQAKAIFKKMRILQKSIEDAFYKSQLYNYMGLILYIRNSAEQRFSFLRWFFSIDTAYEHHKSEEELKRYYDWSIIGVNHEDIVANNMDAYLECRNRFRSELDDNLLYMNNYETAYRWLIRQNIKEDNNNKFEGRKFNFGIERDRSLEHIYPKSKIGHKSDEGVELDWNDNPLNSSADIKLWREDIKWVSPSGREITGSEHCIGNLVLLYKRDNSKFNDADFSKKNQFFFTDMEDEAFKSRHLIHSTMIFSNVEWNKKEGWNNEQIAHRKYVELDIFDKEYSDNYIKQ